MFQPVEYKQRYTKDSMTSTGKPEKDRGGKIAACRPPASGRSPEALGTMAAIVRRSAFPQFLIDRNHCVCAWNRHLEEITGVREEEVYNTPEHWRAFYETRHPCLSDLLVDESTDMIGFWYPDKWAESPGGDHAFDIIDFFPHLGRKGKWLHFTAVPLRDENGTVIGALESIEDLTRAKLVERALDLTTKKLHLMNTITWHEIENKITSTRGYIEFSKELVHDEDLAKCFESEELLLEKIHDLFRNTRDYQRIGSQPPQWINVGETLRSVRSLLETGSAEAEPAVDSLELFADPSIGLMFAYLIKNTIRNGKPEPEIRIRCSEVSEGLILTYEDNSPGVLPSRKEHLFTEKIVNADNFHLKLMHDVLAFSGMQVRETGEPGKGMRFEISVPKSVYRFVPSRPDR